MDFNDMEGISSLINNLTGGNGIGSLENIDKLSGLLGSKGLGAGSRFPLLLIIIAFLLFNNRGGYNNRNNCQQYSCRCYRKGSKKHRRKQCCKCCGYGSGYGGQGGHGGYGGGYGGYGGGYGCGSGYGGCGGGYGSNIIFIIIILFFIRLGKSSGLGSISSILNCLPTQGTDDIDTNEEE